MKTQLLALLLIFSSPFFSQDNKLQKDKDAIKKMCGCFDVDFHFAETFSYSKDSNYLPSKEKHVGALEWAQLVEETDNKIVIQHLLIVGSESNPFVMKHWRQDWIYENTDFYMFDHDNAWKYKKFSDDDVSGQWTQKVFQVDDSPRYEGSATWVHVDGKNYWESTTDAPLPRREYTKRSDYNLTVRTNRHEIVSDGWVHDQDNKKVIRENGLEDIVMAEEKGVNFYKKLNDLKCKAAQDWWVENKEYWASVRESWEEIYGNNKDIKLANKIEGKHLYNILFSMNIKASKKKIHKAISEFIVVEGVPSENIENSVNKETKEVLKDQ